MVEPLHPQLMEALKRSMPGVDDADIDRFEELVALRFSLDPERDAGQIRTLDLERQQLLSERLHRFQEVYQAFRARRATQAREAQARESGGEPTMTERPPATGGTAFLEPLVERLSSTRSVRPGTITLHLTGGRPAHLLCEPSGVRTAEGPLAGAEPPLLEVYGDADRIRAILDGEKDAVREFLAGGLRVRGDLRYLSDLGMELGFLRRPL
jgi:hypothetical protein